MGLFDNLFGKEQPGPDWVRGTARVIASSAPPHSATWANVSATLVVEVPGMPAFQTDYSKLNCRVSKWPHPGTALPVAVDPRNPHNLAVFWDEVATGADAGRQQAAAIVDHLNQSGNPSPGGEQGMPTTANDVISQIQQMFPGAQVHVSGHGAPSPQPMSTPPGAPVPPPNVSVHATRSDADPVARLEKLAKLRDASIVTEEQFVQLRAQILEQGGLDDE
ncbi:hypothetical protein GOARA_026_00070 [Gordonia araii NBRC 100433]|uniref:SHOCT domain-containing protein n=1 Tax=Gordonia araii NBRC 100433 TaxID=1073574 RepID=G7GZF3_9ACTN|nr:SHOCT domain-containing protein [Gordonia araii]NNG97950.1 SHOCT domain-containing protein [Gordonia araii NBRC 100433]GAB08978.1 hypothetical protein GOARA_026_00070 [Gordonia araii NBRC 100433]